MRVLKFFFMVFIFLAGFVTGKLTNNDSTEIRTTENSSNTDNQVTISTYNRSSVTESVMWVEGNIMNIRQRPQLSAAIVGKRYRGDTVTVVNTTSQWSEIRINGTDTGWIFTPLLSDEWIEPGPPILVDNLEFKVTGKNDIWWQFSYNVGISILKPLENTRKVVVTFLDSDGFALDNDISYIYGITDGQQFVLRNEAHVDMPLASRVDSLAVMIQ